jgi:hypothetical protein
MPRKRGAPRDEFAALVRLLDELAPRAGSDLPPLYPSGLRFEADPPGVEEFPTVPPYRRGRGDCAL